MYGILMRYGITVRYFIGSTKYGKLSRTVLNPRTSVDITRNFLRMWNYVIKVYGQTKQTIEIMRQNINKMVGKLSAGK